MEDRPTREEELLKECKELRELLSNKYNAKTFCLLTSAMSLALLGSIIGWISLEVKLIHPYLSIPAFVGAFGLMCLSFWRIRGERNNESK